MTDPQTPAIFAAVNAPHQFSYENGIVVTEARADYGRGVLTVGPGLKTGMPVHYDDPAEIGPDRIADAVAARAVYGSPCIVIDLGTTTNIEVIDARGTFVGGVIAPGLALGARSLSAAAARLPQVEPSAPTHVIGRNTREAMRSGVPVIISRQSGVAEVLDYAIKVNYWDVDALADAIYGLLTYPALGRMFASKGLEEVTGLKWTNAAAKIKTVYETVVAEANN